MANQPLGRDLHIDQYLTNLSHRVTNQGFIADGLFPVLSVQKQSDLIRKYDQSHWFRDEAHIRAPGTEAEGSGWTVSRDSYYCHRYSFATEINDEDRDNADSQWNLDADAVDFLTEKIRLRRERNWATNFFVPGVWGNDQVGGVDFTQWNNYGASDPAPDIAAYKDSVELIIGREPNVLVVGKEPWLQLRFHPALIDVIKYTERGTLTSDLIRALLEVERIEIGKALYTASPEGTPEANVAYSRIWGKHALLMWVPDRPGLNQPASGYTFVWQRVPNAFQYIKRFRYERKEVDVFEINSYFTHTLMGADAGVFLQDVVV